jgi:hypothetical protein
MKLKILLVLLILITLFNYVGVVRFKVVVRELERVAERPIYNSVLTLEEYAVFEASKRNIDIETLLRVVQCESGWDQWAKNKNSSASGLFQILRGSWEYYGCSGNVFAGRDNIDCAMIIIERDGFVPWDSSKSCWGV